MLSKGIIKKEALREVIKALDRKLDEPTPLTAIGGTALTLMDMKAGSFDIDFILDKESNLLKTIVTVEIYKLGYETQIQESGIIVTTILPKDYRKVAYVDEELSRQLQHIQLRIL